MQMWYRLQKILFVWYEQIQEEALDSAVLHADETGWRTDGTTNWLWCFGNDHLTYYLIDKSRGSPACEVFHQRVSRNADYRFLGSLQCGRLRCATKVFGAFASRVGKHREIQRRSDDWAEFAKKLRRLVGDAIRLWRQKSELQEETYASRRGCLYKRLDAIISTTWEDSHVKRLTKRLKTASQRIVHVFGSRRGCVREQPCGTFDSHLL